jgi:hypothetical protein
MGRRFAFESLQNRIDRAGKPTHWSSMAKGTQAPGNQPIWAAFFQAA